MNLIVGAKVAITEEVVGYYVKGCGIEISIPLPRGRQGKITRKKPTEVEIDFGNVNVWVPKDKVEMAK